MFEFLLVILEMIFEKGHDEVIAMIVTLLYPHIQWERRLFTSLDELLGPEVFVFELIVRPLVNQHRCMGLSALIGSNCFRGIVLFPELLVWNEKSQ